MNYKLLSAIADIDYEEPNKLINTDRKNIAVLKLIATHKTQYKFSYNLSHFCGRLSQRYDQK